VIYYFHDDQHPLLLLALYAKNAQSDMTSEQRREFSALVALLKSEF